MFDPISLAAVTAMLGAVGSGMANEAGKRTYELLGALATRFAGRQVTAPSTPAEWSDLARMLADGAGRDDRDARALADLAALARSAQSRPYALSATAPLPPGVRSFTDREAPLRMLTREASRKPDGRPRRALVHGPEGIGTSALAVQWTHAYKVNSQVKKLYVDLRGDTADQGRDASVALRLLLRGLGLARQDIPPAQDERAGLFHQLTAGQQMVVILDHAQSFAQIAPLLSGAPGVFTIVVGRRPLPGLDAVSVPVGPLGSRDATRLLTAVAGKETVTAARAVLPSLLDRCAGSPYALQAAASALLAGTGTPGVAGRPARGSGPAAAMDDPVHAVAVDAYARLDAEAARCYRLWALRPWPALGPAAAGAVARIPEPEAARLLAELAGSRLLDPVENGRYRYRDSVRRHAEAQAHRESGIAECAQAVRRAVDHFLGFAVHADLAALPERWHLGPRYDEARGEPLRYPDQGAALAALKPELGNLKQAVYAAEEFHDWDSAWQLVEALWTVQLKAGRHDELVPVLRIGARVTREHFPGTRTAGRMHAQLGLALLELRRFDEAEEALRFAAEAERAAGHLRGLATAVESLGLLRLAQWRWQEALDRFDEAGGVLDGIHEGDDGFRDVPRARALLHRHRGRALRGLDRPAEALEESDTALRFFRARAESYNSARTLTDIAETRLRNGTPRSALPLVEEALTLLRDEGADHHVAHLLALRAQCADDNRRTGRVSGAE